MDPADQRIDVGTNATGILVSAIYAFDGAAFDGSFTLNNTNFVYATPQKQGYTVLTSAGDAHEISAILTNDATFCIWDRILVASVVVDEPYHDPNDNARITVGLQYEYDNSAVLAGSFEITGYSLTHVGSGNWEVQVTISTYQSIDFDDLTACDATLHGISEYNMNGNSVTVYWDRLEFYTVTVGDGRINIGASTDVEWSVRLENAGISITTGVVSQMTGDIVLVPTAGVYTATVSENTVGSVSYSILSASLGEIGQFIQSASDAVVIWDRVVVTSISATILSLDINTGSEIHVTLAYEYDSAALTTGFVNLHDGGAAVPMYYDSTGGYWTITITKSTPGNYSFTVDSVSGNNHGITSLDTDGRSVVVEWVGAPGFVIDTMTLMIIGGGAGIGILGLAIVASRRKRGVTPAGLSTIESDDFGVVEPVEVETPAEPELIEPEVEDIPEEIEPEVIEPSEPEDIEEPGLEVETEEAELPPIDEELEEIEVEEATIEPEYEVEEFTEPEVSVEEELVIEPEPEIVEEPLIEPEVEPEIELEEPAEVPEAIWEPIAEPEVEPDVVDYDDIPEEFIEPEAPLELSNMTKRELLDLILSQRAQTTHQTGTDQPN
jgi:hypothetical protein